MILEGGREIDAVILTDVLDRLGRELLGFRTDPHGIEDMPTTGEVTAEGSAARRASSLLLIKRFLS